MKRKKLYNRIISAVLAFAFMVSTGPTSALADELAGWGSMLMSASELTFSDAVALAAGDSSITLSGPDIEGKITVNDKGLILLSNVTVDDIVINSEASFGPIEDESVEPDDSASDGVYEISPDASASGGVYEISSDASLLNSPVYPDAASEHAQTSSLASVSGNGVLLGAYSSAAIDYDGYTIYLADLAGDYYDLTQSITVNGESYTFTGLGSEAAPFRGNIESQSTTRSIILDRPLFNYVDVSCVELISLSTLRLSAAVDSAVMLAENITGAADSSWNSLAVICEGYSITDGQTTYSYYPGSFINTLKENASLELASVSYNAEARAVSDGSSGLFCNTMEAGAELTIASAAFTTVSVTSGNAASAGGLVGAMGAQAALSINNAIEIGSSFTITGGNAGGIIGSAEDAVLSGLSASVNGATVKGSLSAGGLIGSYTVNGVADTFTEYDGSSSLKVASVSLFTNSFSASLGGVMGSLCLSADFNIENAEIESGILTTAQQANYGGLVGKVTAQSASALPALNISGSNSISMNSEVNTSAYGGAVGLADGVYISLDETFEIKAVNAAGAQTAFGGFVGVLQNSAVAELLDTADFSYSAQTTLGEKAGGVVGYAGRGTTLCLSGTTDLSNCTFSNYANTTSAQIAGQQEAAIIYAKQGWTLSRPSSAQPVDDIGGYGSVIRLGGNMGRGASDLAVTGLSADLISQNALTHRTEIKAGSKAELSGSSITIANADQFAILAIAEQTKGAFGIYGSANDYLVKNMTITLSGAVNLSNTGICGLQRDTYAGEFTGSFDGGENTLTLDIGSVYGLRSGAAAVGAGSGQLHRHTRSGLFSTIGAGSVIKNVTIAGSINLYPEVDMYSGAAAAYAGGSCTIGGASAADSVTTAVTVTVGKSSSSKLGGLIGEFGNNTLNLKNCIGQAVFGGIGDECFGGLVGGASQGTVNAETVTLSGTISSTANNAKVGGLIALSGYSGSLAMSLNSVTVNGQSISSSGSSTAGGFLGYDWQNTNVAFGSSAALSDGVSVEGTSSISLTGKASCGALVFSATGLWSVNSIDIKSMSAVSWGGNLGLLLCKGIDAKKGVYLELTDPEAYKIDGSAVSLSSTGGSFDELCVFTTNTTVAENGNAVISIAAAGNTAEEIVGNYYQNRTTNNGSNWDFNNYSRYYYNLHTIRNTAVSGAVDTAEELMLWSVYRYSKGVMAENYFGLTSAIMEGTIGGNVSSTIDLSGYSYYPVDVSNEDITVKNVTIKFNNELIEVKEALTGSDGLVRTTYGTLSQHNQHYLMHTGLLRNFTNAAGNGAKTEYKLNVNNLTLQGNTGKNEAGSGALVSGTIRGVSSGANYIAALIINGLTLDGCYIYGDKAEGDYAPLFVNKAGSYTSITASGISTANYSNPSKTNPAATSLIGAVGSEKGKYISVAFNGNIDLNGREAESIFSRATLLDSLGYCDAVSSGYYHFTADEYYTFGKEISDSVENSGLQENYFETDTPVTDGGNTAFSSGYLPYVCRTDIRSSLHELAVNISIVHLTAGCGTFDDPYILNGEDGAKLLKQIAAFLNTGSSVNGWRVNKVITADITGGEENHSVTYKGDGVWNDAEMLNYLLNAYYMITDDLTLENFAGLGTTQNAFKGVIVGKKADGTAPTVTINAANNISGLINVSYGSVVRNLNIVYTEKKLVKETGDSAIEYINAVGSQSYFGGVIGYVKGGDNIVDSVSVGWSGFSLSLEINDSSSSDNTKKYCVGGLFGLVEAGGVILKDIAAGSNMPVPTAYSSYQYVDSIIGRVLDGFVIYEGSGSGCWYSSDKNYSIAYIPADAQISIADSKVSIASPEQLLILCDIINSGAACKGAALAYKNGTAKVRTADYSKVGDCTQAEFAAARADEVISDSYLPYMIKNHAGNNAVFWGLCGTFSAGAAVSAVTSLKIEFTADIDVSPYKNGYRAIGGRYNTTASSMTEKTNLTSLGNERTGNFKFNTPQLSLIEGNNYTLTVDCQIIEEQTTGDNFHVNTVGGLINNFRHLGAAVQNLTVSGNVKLTKKITVENGTNLAAGGLVGIDSTADNKTSDSYYTLKFKNITLENFNVKGTAIAGGIIGLSNTYAQVNFVNMDGSDANGKLEHEAKPGVKSHTNLIFEDCAYNSCSFEAGIVAGGFLGIAANSGKYFLPNSYSQVANLGLQSASVTVSYTADKEFGTGTVITENDAAITGAFPCGFAGMIGFSLEQLTIGSEDYRATLTGITIVAPGDKNNSARIGGIVGMCENGKVLIQNIAVTSSDLGRKSVTDPTKAGNNCGGLIACWYSGGTVTVKNCTVSDSTLRSLGEVGGLFGYMNQSVVTIQDASVIRTTIDGYEKNIGGVIGVCSKNISMTNITVEDTQINTRNSGKGDAGGIVGKETAGLNGMNILLKNVTFNNPGRAGRIAAIASDLRLIGVSFQSSGTTGIPTREIRERMYTNVEGGNNNYGYFTTGYGQKNYVIYDGYLDDAIAEAAEMNSEPAKTIPSLTLKGDTAFPSRVLTASGNTTLYQNVAVANGEANRLTADCISTYNAQQLSGLISDEDNFEVLLIDGDASIIRQYLNTATNGGYQSMYTFENWSRTVSSSRKANITTEDNTGKPLTKQKDWRLIVSIDRYVKSGDGFVKADPTEYPATLIYHYDTGEFTATAQYDNQQNTFTLITIRVTGVNEKQTRTYHIPVIVRRMLQVDFTATMVSGTMFDTTETVLQSYNTHALATVGENVTGYLTVSYNSNASGTAQANYDWVNYLESGGNLLGSYEKTVNTGNEQLAEGTTITLIDCQNNDRRYTARVPSGGSKLELFCDKLNYVDSSGNHFEPATLSELLQITAEADSAGKWIKLDSSSEAKVCDINGDYYRLKTDSDGDAQTYALTIGNSSPTENYFVVINSPTKGSHRLTLSADDMDWSESSGGTPLEVHQLHRYKVGSKYIALRPGEYEASFNHMENYNISLTDNTQSGIVSVTRDMADITMLLDVTNTFSFNVNNHSDSETVYLQLRASLKKTEDGITAGVAVPDDAHTDSAGVKFYAYFIGTDEYKYYFVYDSNTEKLVPYRGSEEKPVAISYQWNSDGGEMILPFAVDSSGSAESYIDIGPLREAAKTYGRYEGANIRNFYIEAEANIVIGTASADTNGTLPVKNEDITNFTKVDCYSRVSITPNGLNTTLLRGEAHQDIKYFFEESGMSKLTLEYNDISQLGINVGVDLNSDIDTTLILDVSEAEGFNQNPTAFGLLNTSDTLSFTFTLSQKGQTGLSSENYGSVAIGSYLAGISFDSMPNVSVEGYTITIHKNADGSWPCYNRYTGQFILYPTFTVKTDNVSQYSNYRIAATAVLSADNTPKEFGINSEEASITYTLAKINVRGIWSAPE